MGVIGLQPEADPGAERRVEQAHLPGMDSYFGGDNPDIEALSQVELEAEVAVLTPQISDLREEASRTNAQMDALIQRRVDVVLALARITAEQ